jgi:hypothetical protein
MTTALVRNWTEFQHYKDRSPPWIKLHRALLDNFDYQRLPLASRALAPMLWLLAAESNDGQVCVDVDFLAFRLRQPEADIAEGLKSLIELRFLIVASEVLAPCLQPATPERETETETERETETETEREAEGEGEGASAPPPRQRKSETTITDWLLTLGAEDAIPEDDAVFRYAEQVKLPRDFLALAWREFEDRHGESGKKYKDWRAAFRKCVRDNWYRLWFIDDTGQYVLTTSGKQAERARP